MYSTAAHINPSQTRVDKLVKSVFVICRFNLRLTAYDQLARIVGRCARLDL